MANVYGSAVVFTKELNVWTLSARLTFGAAGAVTVSPINSKGIIAVNPETVAFTGATTNSSTSLSSVSSFDGIFAGMTITGPAGDLQASTTVSSWTATTAVLTLSKQAITTEATTAAFFATGGRYRVQFGTQSITGLTPFVKLLGMSVVNDLSSGSASGAYAYAQVAPPATHAFIIDNKLSVKTIPATQATNSTDASVAIQFGYGVGPGTGFIAQAPADGTVVTVMFTLGNSYGT